MKILYLDCSMGAAGDMLTAALLELLPNPDAFLVRLNALGIPGVRFEKESAIKCGISGTHMHVYVDGEEEGADGAADASAHEHPHEHAAAEPHGHIHRHLSDIERIVNGLPLPEDVKENVIAVYRTIAEAESKVHGKPVAEVHFHEVGAMDAVADIAAVCLLMHEIAPDETVVSPVHVGSGTVRCAHGILPVPAPATELLLRGCPVYGGSIQGELCTPTGAALLVRFADRFGPMPPMRTERSGYGCGKKDFPRANCLRAFLGTGEGSTDSIIELSCNVDDMTGEAVGFAMERLLEAGARDVYTVPIGMKKNRPGLLLRVMCAPADRERMLSLLFRHTTTIGVRESTMTRYVLDRREEVLATPYGEVRQKISSGYGAVRTKLEFEDLKKIALSRGISLAEAQALVRESLPGEK